MSIEIFMVVCCLICSFLTVLSYIEMRRLARDTKETDKRNQLYIDEIFALKQLVAVLDPRRSISITLIEAEQLLKTIEKVDKVPITKLANMLWRLEEIEFSTTRILDSIPLLVSMGCLEKGSPIQERTCRVACEISVKLDMLHERQAKSTPRA